MEVLLRCLPAQEGGERKGEEKRVQGTSGKREHPSSRESGDTVHVTLVDNVQQRVAQAVVLLEE
jgi:hypothetical protein